MAKKAVKEKPEEKKGKTVSVEMSPEQFDKFTKFAAEQEDKEVIESEVEPMFTMHLNYSHNLSGVRFGPGKVIVPESISGTLAFQEDQAFKAELALNTERKRFYQVFQNGQSRPVRQMTGG